jgi:predicted ATP-grasp superfamily ATP-dependent carboligase
MDLGLPSPGYAVVGHRDQLEGAAYDLRLPLVMKSTLKKTGGAAKAARVETIEEAFDFYHALGEGEIILEEWIPGTDRDVYFCLQAYDEDSDLLASFTGRKIRQWPPLLGGTASAEPAEVPELKEATTRLFKHVGFQGICSMEYKYDERDGRYYAIEPTVGRTDFQSGIAPANGINIPLAAFGEMAKVRVRAIKPRRPVKWVNTLADTLSAQRYMERGELTPKEWRRSLAGARVSAVFAVDDPAPWVSDLFRRVKNRLTRRFKKKREAP